MPSTYFVGYVYLWVTISLATFTTTINIYDLNYFHDGMPMGSHSNESYWWLLVGGSNSLVVLRNSTGYIIFTFI